MSKARDIANILSANTAVATDVEISSAVSTHISATDPHGDRADTITKISAHSSATDPHGDRASAATLYATKASFPSDAWTSYTPTWTSDSGTPSIGNGTLGGRYKQFGKTVFFNFKLAYGSTTTGGSGAWMFGLPVTAYNSNYQFSASILNDGVAWYGAIGNGSYKNSTNYFTLTHQNDTATTVWGGVTATAPITFGAGDIVTVSGSYEAA